MQSDGACRPGIGYLAQFCGRGGVAQYDRDGQRAQALGRRARLQFRDFEQGVRLTLEGLKLSVSRRERAAGLNNLCAGYAGLQRYDEALSACDEALTLNIARWRVYNNRALALLGKNQVAAARRDVEAGLAINPDSQSLQKVLKLVEIAEISPDITIAALDAANPGR